MARASRGEFSLEQLRLMERAVEMAVYQLTLTVRDRSVMEATRYQLQAMIRGAERREAVK